MITEGAITSSSRSSSSPSSSPSSWSPSSPSSLQPLPESPPGPRRSHPTFGRPNDPGKYHATAYINTSDSPRLQFGALPAPIDRRLVISHSGERGGDSTNALGKKARHAGARTGRPRRRRSPAPSRRAGRPRLCATAAGRSGPRDAEGRAHARQETKGTASGAIPCGQRRSIDRRSVPAPLKRRDLRIALDQLLVPRPQRLSRFARHLCGGGKRAAQSLASLARLRAASPPCDPAPRASAAPAEVVRQSRTTSVAAALGRAGGFFHDRVDCEIASPCASFASSSGTRSPAFSRS